MASVVTSDRLIAERPEVAAAGVRAIIGAQRALREDVSLATGIGQKLFPAMEAELIADIVMRDLPFYSPLISRDAVERMIGFSQASGVLKRHPAYEEVVATQFAPLWTNP
jgi:NitT/TauT family transport system substrate-binding protein